jgi:DNA-binding SARP family transcriptional activator
MIQSYQAFEENLQKELGIKPMSSTQTLYQRLLAENR